MSTRIHERRRVGRGIEVAVHADRVLGGAADRVELREDAKTRGVEAGTRVIQIGGPRGGDEHPALVSPGRR